MKKKNAKMQVWVFAHKKILREILLSRKVSFSRLQRKKLQNQHFHIDTLYANTILNIKIHRNIFL